MRRELGGVLEAVEGFLRFAALERGARSLALRRECGIRCGMLRNGGGGEQSDNHDARWHGISVHSVGKVFAGDGARSQRNRQ